MTDAFQIHVPQFPRNITMCQNIPLKLRRLGFVVAGLAGLAITGCATVEDRAQAQAKIDAQITASQGEKVDRICFANQIDGWRPLDRDALLVREGVNDWYQLDLAGPCDPRDAMLNIAFDRFAGSGCLSRGDRVIIPGGLAGMGGSCFITAIYEWDDDADVAAPENVSENVSDSGPESGPDSVRGDQPRDGNTAEGAASKA